MKFGCWDRKQRSDGSQNPFTLLSPVSGRMCSAVPGPPLLRAGVSRQVPRQVNGAMAQAVPQEENTHPVND